MKTKQKKNYKLPEYAPWKDTFEKMIQEIPDRLSSLEEGLDKHLAWHKEYDLPYFLTEPKEDTKELRNKIQRLVNSSTDAEWRIKNVGLFVQEILALLQ